MNDIEVILNIIGHESLQGAEVGCVRAGVEEAPAPGGSEGPRRAEVPGQEGGGHGGRPGRPDGRRRPGQVRRRRRQPQGARRGRRPPHGPGEHSRQRVELLVEQELGVLLEHVLPAAELLLGEARPLRAGRLGGAIGAGRAACAGGGGAGQRVALAAGLVALAGRR